MDNHQEETLLAVADGLSSKHKTQFASFLGMMDAIKDYLSVSVESVTISGKDMFPIIIHQPIKFTDEGETLPAGRHFFEAKTEQVYAATPTKAPAPLDDIPTYSLRPLTRYGTPLHLAILIYCIRLYMPLEEKQAVAFDMFATPSGKDDTPRVSALPVDNFSLPLDKLNLNIWDMLEADENGQLAINFDTASDKDRKKGKQAIVYYCISFEDLGDDLKITKTLDHYDKRVYLAAAALYTGGNKKMSATQIYKAMGNKGSPKAGDVKKINDSLTKMGTARIYIDSSDEVKTNKGYPKFIYDAPLLPFERGRSYINNTLCDAAIELYREPPLITFARERRNITTLPRDLLESPVSKTNSNLRIDHYLIERISRMKNSPNIARKILYKSLYEKCGITTRMQKTRAPEKISRYLEHYKTCGFIQGFTEGKDGITIKI